jgi:hypothetical protein
MRAPSKHGKPPAAAGASRRHHARTHLLALGALREWRIVRDRACNCPAQSARPREKGPHSPACTGFWGSPAIISQVGTRNAYDPQREALAFTLPFDPHPSASQGKDHVSAAFQSVRPQGESLMSMPRRLWADEAGFVISSELVLVATILVIGMIVGLTELRNQVLQELTDVALAIGCISQTYTYSTVTGHTAATAGSAFQDTTDYCDNGGFDPPGEAACINVHGSPIALEGSTISWSVGGP